MATSEHELESINVSGLKATMKDAGNIGLFNEATCSTAAGTAAKEVTKPTSFTLTTGATIVVKFTNAITVASATLNVGSTGAKAIYYRGAALAANRVAAGDRLILRYNGTQFDIIGHLDTDTNTQAVSSVVGQTGAVTATQIGTALTNAGYKLTDNNTWNAASTSQAGYVPAATKGKFLHSNASTGNLEWVNDNNTTYTPQKLGSGIGTCSTSSGTALAVSLTGYEMVQNGIVAVTFDNDVPANATLNINGKGAKPIIYKGAAIEADTIKADDTVMFAYDGTNYVVTSLGAGGEVKPKLLYGYIILDQTSSNPTTKVLDMKGNGYSNYQRPEVITAIRNASHRYVGTFANNVMILKQLDDTDGTKYADGTSAATDIATQGKDVFMRLPYFFTRATEVETDKWKIEFVYDPIQTVNSTRTPDEENWKQWGGNDLIGVYEAVASNTGDNTTGGLYSRNGVTATGAISLTNFKTKARNRGTGFTCVKWRHQNLMAILFYAYYGHTNCQALCGSGSNSSDKSTGLKNSLGMTDTNSSNGNTDSINFWGLENWWGDKYEIVDNAVVNDGTWVITEDDGNIRTPTGTVGTTSSWIYSSKFILGDHLDTIPATGETGGSDTQGYCDAQIIAGGDSRIVLRSGSNSDTKDGLTTEHVYNAVSITRGDAGTRLAFTGTIIIVY